MVIRTQPVSQASVLDDDAVGEDDGASCLEGTAEGTLKSVLSKSHVTMMSLPCNVADALLEEDKYERRPFRSFLSCREAGGLACVCAGKASRA